MVANNKTSPPRLLCTPSSSTTMTRNQRGGRSSDHKHREQKQQRRQNSSNNKHDGKQRRRKQPFSFLLLTVVLNFIVVVINVYYALSMDGALLSNQSIISEVTSNFHVFRESWDKIDSSSTTKSSGREKERGRQAKEAGEKLSNTTEETPTSSCLVGNETVTLPRVFPNFIIVGAQKAGTTVVSHLLDRVPNLLNIKGKDQRTKGKEAHFWGKLVLPPRSLSSEERCKLKQHYFNHWDAQTALENHPPNNNKMLFEKTPTYLCIPQVPGNIVKVLTPHKPKIIVILRDPVARAYLHHKMTYSGKARAGGTFPTFDQSVEKNILQLKEKGAIKAPPFYYPDNNGTQPRQQWRSKDFDDLGAKLEHYSGMLERGFYANQIRNYMSYFTLGESLMVIRYEILKERKSQTLNEILRFIGSPPHNFTEKDLNEYISPTKLRYRYYPPVTNETREYLKLMYKPFNDDLASLLGESWRGVWE